MAGERAREIVEDVVDRKWRVEGAGQGLTSSSCPGLSRASTFFTSRRQDVDGRDKPGHDGIYDRASAQIDEARHNPGSGARPTLS
jgi:hypothetical protein